MLDMPNEDEFIKLCDNRMTIKDLAKKYFVCEMTISRWIKFYGLNNRGKNYKKEVLEKLINTNATKIDIADSLGCCVVTLDVYLNKFGLQRC